MTRRTLTCGECGAEYTVDHNRKSLYCSSRCRYRQRERTPERKARRPRGLVDRACEWCGHLFNTRRSMPARFCSRSCFCKSEAVKRTPTTPIPWSPCSWCSTPFIKRHHRETCSAICYDWASGRRSRATMIEYRQCPECWGGFVAKAGQVRDYCSGPCAKRAHKRTRKHSLRSTFSEADRITLAELGERDRWRCHICGERVTKTRGNDDRAPSIDHLVPVSVGGSHTWTNVALAHRLCNSLRGDRGPAQLLLVHAQH